MQALKSALLNIRAKETPPAPKKIAEEELA